MIVAGKVRPPSGPVLLGVWAVAMRAGSEGSDQKEHGGVFGLRKFIELHTREHAHVPLSMFCFNPGGLGFGGFVCL